MDFCHPERSEFAQTYPNNNVFLTMAWYISQSLLKKPGKYQKPKPQQTKNESIQETSSLGRKESKIQDQSRPSSEEGFVNLMDLCHMKPAELAKHLQKHEGGVVPQGDNVKDDHGSKNSIHGTRHINFASGGGKILGYNFQTPWYGG